MRASPPSPTEGFPGTGRAIVETRDGATLPVQVDGYHIGDLERVEYDVAPWALRVVG